MKTFSRIQLRTAFESFCNEDDTYDDAYLKVVSAFLGYLDTYQFEEEGMMATADRMTGKVKWFNSKKGFGFIQLEGSKDEDIFVHISDLKGIKNLNEGDNVEFDVENGKKGIKAVDVVRL